MLIIYDDKGNIKFATSDDNYVTNYKKKHKKLPFIQYGSKSLWLKNREFINDVEMYKVLDNKIVKRDENEINKILNERKNNIIYKTINIKGLEVIEENENNGG